MFNTYTTINDYSCQLDGHDLELARWSKDENMVYCEDSSALFFERRTGGIAKAITALFASVVK